jgi:hypothetical protein
VLPLATLAIKSPLFLLGVSFMALNNKAIRYFITSESVHQQISILLTIIAALLWAHSILSARLEIGYLGLIHSLPVTFFIALALLTIASAILWVSKEKHSKLLLLQLLILVSALWLIPLITGGSPPFMNHAYSNLGLTNYIAQGSHFSSNEIWYLSWPGAHILFAMMTIAGGINFEPILSVFPFFLVVASLLPLYILLRNILGEGKINYCWAGLWLFCLGSWTGQAYFGPQCIAFFLLLMVLVVITLPSLWEKGSPKLALLAAAGLLAVAIVPTHLLTSLALVLMLAAFSVARRTKRLLPVIGLCLVIIVSWDVTGGGHITKSLASEPLWSTAMETPGSTLNLAPGAIAQTEIIQHLRGSESHIAVVEVRLLHSAIFVLLGLVGAIFVLLFRRKSNTVAILAMFLAPLLLLPISGHYGEELLHRVYLFALPFMAYFGAMLLDIKSKLPWFILCLLLIITIPTNVISTYGNQALDYFPKGRVAGLKFFDSTTTRGYVTGASPLGNTSNILQYQHLDYSQLEWQGNELYTQGGEEMPYYIAISNRDRAWYGWFWGNYEFIGEVEQSMDNAVNCGLIYINPVLKLYESDG